MIRTGGALLLALCLLGKHAAAEEVAAGVAEEALAEEGVPDQEPAWIPSLSVDFETFQYSTTTTITNSLNPPAQEVTNGSPQVVARIGGELMGPRFEGIPGQPRLFVQGGVGLNTFQGSTIAETGLLQGATERDISQFNTVRAGDLARTCNNPRCPATATVEDFEGQGSEVTGVLQTPEWNAALGVAFDLPLYRSLLLQFKPSVAYNVEQVNFSGTIRTVIEEPPGPTPQQQEIFTIHEGTASGSTTNHSLGLGFELDLALFRSTRPIRASLFLDTRFLWLLDNPTTAFSDSGGTTTRWPDPFTGQLGPSTTVTTPSDGFASYQVERDSFEFRGGAGVRFSWVGFGPR